MPYPFPQAMGDPALQQALDIAMDYLEYTGQSFPYSETERVCALTILNEWHSGKRHRIWLANKAIVAIEQAMKPAPQSLPITVLGPVRRL
jgi:hypothetical protein